MNTLTETKTFEAIQLRTRTAMYMADLHTPVSLYMRLRDRFSGSILLESTDFSSPENSHSYIGVDPIGKFEIRGGYLSVQFPGKDEVYRPLTQDDDVPSLFQAYMDAISIQQSSKLLNGLLGHTSYEAIQYFDTHQLDHTKKQDDLPEINYIFYRFIMTFNHFRDELHVLENLPEGQISQLHTLEQYLKNPTFATYPFERVGAEQSNLTDEEFMEMVRKGKHHCQQGDVFQIVVSRQYNQAFQGDEFNVYRKLRSINPSPYLFYFDYGSYKIFGSSPEAQLVIRDGKASVNPIAGTYRRTGRDDHDREQAQLLADDPKENAEHIMLVDLARNDLSRHTRNVEVKTLMDIHFYSHVIHLVSRVEGELPKDASPIQIFADTFPAGTLSGAPKYRALELIHEYENKHRSFYGGAIGYIGFDGSMNQAIVIRSFLSYRNKLYYQAGAGVVTDSVPEKELQEVKNKLGALKQAIF